MKKETLAIDQCLFCFVEKFQIKVQREGFRRH